MKPTLRIHLCLFVLTASFAFPANAQTSHQQASADRNILAYIDSGWNTLSRSMSECKSLVDPKVVTPPILYLPYGASVPPAVALAHRQCNVEVRHLPRRIVHIGDVRVAEIPAEGLLYLPNRYVVPGGRFNEMYGWDSYFIILGLLQDQRADLARDMIENFFYEIENYGAILNANRTYFFTRSQPPLLSSMIRELYEHPPGQNSDQHSNPHLSKTWLARAYSYAERDHALWDSASHRGGDTGLARYHDIGEGPVPEMADDSNYYPDVIRWLLAHPGTHTGYLVAAPDDPTPVQAAALATASCDIAVSKVCSHAYFKGHRLSSAFYQGDRAMRESGFDSSFRFGPFSGSTEDYAPVCLNSLLYKYELDLAHFATLLSRPAEAAQWRRRAAARQAAINKFLWNPQKGMFYDYDFITRQPSTYNYVTALYPLWAGLATPQQAAALEHNLPLFEHEGGLAMSDTNSGTQWDYPFGWAPTNWLATEGLARYGYNADADRIATGFTATVLQNFLRDGTIREKYNVVSGSANVKVAAGYKSNVVGFGWTNGVYLRMNDLLTRSHEQAAGSRNTQHSPQ